MDVCRLQMFVELWGEGTDMAELRAAIEAYPAARKVNLALTQGAGR
jgi:hypothetical protein